MNALISTAMTPQIPTPITLQHYPAAPALRQHVTGYFSIDGPMDAGLLNAARDEDEAALVFDLGDHPLAWMLRTGRVREQAFVGPVFGALLKPGCAERLSQGEPNAAFATQRLLLQLRAAPSMAFRIVALDRYLIARLVVGSTPRPL